MPHSSSPKAKREQESSDALNCDIIPNFLVYRNDLGHRRTYMALRVCTCTSYFLKLIKFINKILYFYILFYLYLYN